MKDWFVSTEKIFQEKCPCSGAGEESGGSLLGHMKNGFTPREVARWWMLKNLPISVILEASWMGVMPRRNAQRYSQKRANRTDIGREYDLPV